MLTERTAANSVYRHYLPLCLHLLDTLVYGKTTLFKGDIAIRHIFSLVAHHYQDKSFQTGLNFSFFAWVGRKNDIYQLFNWRNFAAICFFKFVKICVFCTHPAFSHFHTGYNFDQIPRKCRGIFQRHKRWNVDARNAMQFQKFNFLSLRMHKRFAWKCDVSH